MQDTEIEQWVTLKQGGDTYNRYQISSLGRVWDSKTEKFSSQVLTGKPQYYYINLSKDCGKRTLRRVHNCMGWSFLGDKPEGDYSVDHIDVNKYNNALYNLRWLDKRGQMNNKRCSNMDNTLIGDFLLRKYTFNSPIYKYLYNVMTQYDLDYTGACFRWLQYITPTTTIKEKLFRPSIEVSGTWYPNRETFCKMHKVSWEKLKKGLSSGATLSEIKDYPSKAVEKSRFDLDGYWMTKKEHCERLYVSHQRVITKVRKLGIPFEEAVKIPMERITKHWVNGEVYNNKDLFIKYGIPPISANNRLSRCKSLLKTLTHYGVDVTDIEAYPCDGKEVVMFNKLLSLT